ncbi:MAG: AraC family transcriptional regulator [Vallitaleaceae bacterium]|nr:AraC family transcriptional regulator [Vallitaleaceae bacterium]
MNDIKKDLHSKKVQRLDYDKKLSFYTPPDIIEKESENEILSNLLLTWAGCYTKAFGHRVHHRILEDTVIIYCVDGGGWLELENKRWDIKKGDIFLCPPNIPHSYGADDLSPWTKYWLHFRGKNAKAYTTLLGLTQENPILKINENPKILSLLQDILIVLRTGYTQSNLLLSTSYLINILTYLNSLSMSEGLNKDGNMTVEKVITYMLDNINSNLTLEQLSHYASLSKYHFIHLFKEKTGYSPMNYFIRLKMHKACEMLGNSSVKVSSVGTTLGFSNPYYFSNTFKRVIGKSPQHYRELL